MTRGLLPLVRWAHANGWTLHRDSWQIRTLRILNWRRGELVVSVSISIDQDGRAIPGRPVTVDVSRVTQEISAEHPDLLRHSYAELESGDLAAVVRWLIAVDVLPAGWRRRPRRSAPVELDGQLELVSL